MQICMISISSLFRKIFVIFIVLSLNQGAYNAYVELFKGSSSRFLKWCEYSLRALNPPIWCFQREQFLVESSLRQSYCSSFVGSNIFSMVHIDNQINIQWKRILFIMKLLKKNCSTFTFAFHSFTCHINL